MRELFRQFSFPGGIPSHVAPETPGSIHEGGELGYALVARLRRGVRQPRPDRRLRGRRRRGRDRAAGRELALEQVPQPGARRRGAADPAPQRLQDRQPDRARAGSRTRSSTRCCAATATRRTSSRATSPRPMHQAMAADAGRDRRRDPRDPATTRAARNGRARPRWPMIVLRTPKGWTGPTRSTATGRGHLALAPGAARRRSRRTRSTCSCSRRGCAPTGPRSCSTSDGRPRPSSSALAPAGERRMSANPHANGGLLLRDLELPDFRDYAVDVAAPGAPSSEATRVLGELAARRHRGATRDRFRVFGPDETASNRLGAVFEATDRAWMAEIAARPTTHLSPRRPGHGGAVRAHSARAGWRATCSPAGTASSTATRRSSTSSTRCSTSTPSG